ncbi:transposable element Tcb1 transposase [Trichonephila clavipes]|nr:transposable element Tcb1 transposase [Trichonephila clavipes]
MRKRLAEGHLRLCVHYACCLDAHTSTPPNWSGAAHEETGLQRNGTRSPLATNPNSISAVMTIVFLCGDPVLNAPTLPLLYSDTPLPQLVWGAIAYNTSSPTIHGTMTHEQYVYDILQHGLPLMQRLPGAIFQQDNARSRTARMSQDCLRTVRFVFNRAYLGSFGMVSWPSHEFERTRGKITANEERNVSRHHTELVCLNVRSYRIVHSR